MWTFYAVLESVLICLGIQSSSQGSLHMDAREWTRGSTIRRTKYRQTSLYGHPLNTDTPLTRTLSMVPSVSVLTGFDWTVLLKSRLQISIRWYSGQELQQEPNYDLVILKCRTRMCETRGICKRSGTSYRYTHQGDINRYCRRYPLRIYENFCLESFTCEPEMELSNDESAGLTVGHLQLFEENVKAEHSY